MIALRKRDSGVKRAPDTAVYRVFKLESERLENLVVRRLRVVSDSVKIGRIFLESESAFPVPVRIIPIQVADVRVEELVSQRVKEDESKRVRLAHVIVFVVLFVKDSRGAETEIRVA